MKSQKAHIVRDTRWSQVFLKRYKTYFEKRLHQTFPDSWNGLENVQQVSEN